MREIDLLVRDALCHPQYSWPVSPVSMQIETRFPPEMGMLADDCGRPVACQASEVGWEGGKCRSKLTFLTALETGACRKYRFQCMAEAEFPICSRETNQTIELSFAGGVVCVQKQWGSSGFITITAANNSEHLCRGVIQTPFPIQAYEARLMENGPVFAVCCINIHFSGDRLYIITLRAYKGLDYIEIDEELHGIGEANSAFFKLIWDGARPRKRYAKYRGQEKIDAYLEPDGRIPFMLKPYTSWVGWWSGKCISFADQFLGLNFGLYINNAINWDDGSYPIWESGNALAVRFYLNAETEQLEWRFPLHEGRRCTALAVYPYTSEQDFHTSPIEKHWFWQEFLRLDKVLGWTLRWPEDKGSYPRYFKESDIPAEGFELFNHSRHREPVSPKLMEDIVYTLSHQMNRLWDGGPVSAREMSGWVYAFDMAAPRMDQRQFDNIRAAFAFMAYVHCDENFMPTRNELAGHPNFLADAYAVGAEMAALFPGHPDAKRWVAFFERAMAINMKYHTRPTVASWGAKGGRWTENTGCYNFASLNPMVKIQMLTRKAFGESVLLYPRVVLWATYMLGILSAPVAGERNFPPQGAHSGQMWDPVLPGYYLRELGESLRRYEPLTAEYLMHVCKPEMREIEERVPGTDMYRVLGDSESYDNTGTRPPLKSSKYTGYGYVLRADVGEESEISVHLQQIDEGPNYRWGRAAQGGCGSVYFYAAGKRYSFNRPEDIGDANMGDVQSGCNFGVLNGHEYRAVGRNELTEPLYDFGFAQYARALAGSYSRPFYQYRAVMLCGNDYFLIHDAVGDRRVHGRFSWFVKKGENFPSIAQLKPGAHFVETNGGCPIDEHGPYGGGIQAEGRYYDGSGDFLTYISHRGVNRDYSPYVQAQEYGARVDMPGRTDYIFMDAAKIYWEQDGIGFEGYNGIIRMHGSAWAEAAVFDGRRIKALGVEIWISGKGGFSVCIEQDRLTGKVIAAETAVITLRFERPIRGELFLNGIKATAEIMSDITDNTLKFTVRAGETEWELTACDATPQPTVVTGSVNHRTGVLLSFAPSAGAIKYELQISKDCGRTWGDSRFFDNPCYSMEGFRPGVKLHVRVRGINGTRSGVWSADYPVYTCAQPPEAPDGLRVWVHDEYAEITWGAVLGVSHYRLYRKRDTEDSFALIYDGQERRYMDVLAKAGTAPAQYAATAVNDNGESVYSNLRDTDNLGLSRWDPRPDESFRRYTRSHEYGYRGFDHWANERMPVMEPYPDTVNPESL